MAEDKEKCGRERLGRYRGRETARELMKDRTKRNLVREIENNLNSTREREKKINDNGQRKM